MPKNSINIGKRIKAVRDRNKLSQDRFARRIGISGKTVSAYETGRTSPPLKILERIVDVYDVPIVNMKKERRTELQLKLQNLQTQLIEISKMIDGNITS